MGLIAGGDGLRALRRGFADEGSMGLGKRKLWFLSSWREGGI